MARLAQLARVEHVLTRTLRCYFLLVNNPVYGKNFDHRNQWMESELQHLAKHFGADLLCCAIRDISWWMSSLSQKIGKRANQDVNGSVLRKQDWVGMRVQMGQRLDRSFQAVFFVSIQSANIARCCELQARTCTPMEVHFHHPLDGVGGHES